MDGRLIRRLRSKYVDTSVTLDSQCIIELIAVIQTSKNLMLNFIKVVENILLINIRVLIKKIV